MTELSNTVKYPLPPYRRLRALAFDPILSRQIETREINDVIITIPWDSGLAIGPVAVAISKWLITIPRAGHFMPP